MVGHLKPLVMEMALAKVLDLLVNEQDPPLTGSPKTRVHLTRPYWGKELKEECRC